VILCPQATREDWCKVTEVIEEADTPLGIDCVRLNEIASGTTFERNVMAYHRVLFKRDTLSVDDCLREEWTPILPPPPETRISDKLISVEQAFLRLQEMAALPVDETRAQMDATIQRFEFSIELAWKMLKCILNYTRGYDILFPKETICIAARENLITDVELWNSMLEETSHTYNVDFADGMYLRIRDQYVPLLADFITRLRKDPSLGSGTNVERVKLHEVSQDITGVSPVEFH